MAQQSFQPPALFLLRYLYYLDSIGQNKSQNPVDLVREYFHDYSNKDIEFDVDHLEKNSLIEVTRTYDNFYVQINFEGRLYVKENMREFENFDSFFLEKDFFPEAQSPETAPPKKSPPKGKPKTERIKKGATSKQLKNEIILKHALSHEKEDKTLQEAGLYNQGLIGYINSQENDEFKMKILQEIYLIDEDDYLYSTNLSEESLKGHRWIPEIGNDFGLVNLQGNDLKLFRYYKKSNIVKGSDHFYCTNPIPEKLVNYGYINETHLIGDVFLWKDSGENRLPVYVYSKTPDIELFESLEEDINSQSNPPLEKFESDADILPDTIAKKDNLGRKTLMEIVYDKVDKLWGELQSDQSFTILLNGEWGSGKSSMLYYFEEFLKENKWSVVQYNAWENQRFDEPWWILVNKVSKEASNSFKPFSSISHWFWKNQLEYSLTYIGAFIISILLIIGLAKDLFGDVKNVGFIGSVLALFGSLWVIVQGTLQNVFKKKTFSALQAKNANDPLEPYKTRFKDVVKNKQVAIFIDDLDRCEVDATVKLLEGIQTLFKNSKVLYVIAADGHWVSNCFDKKYNQFDNLASPGQTIGNQFLQKTFQLIVDVPKLSKPQQQSLLNKYLKREEEKQIDSSAEEDAIEEIEQAETLEQLGEISEGSGGAATKRAAEKAEQIIEQQKEHYMQKLLSDDLMPSNPRQMIRLINLFTLKIQELLISEVLSEVGEENVLRYILFATEYPEYNYAIHHLSEDKIKEKFPDLESKLGSLEIEMIRNFL